MPKPHKYILEVQKQRLKQKEKLSKYVPGRISLQVLGTGAEGAPRSLYVFSDQSRYLFNCGEGTQRLAHEHKMKLAKLEHIFITQSCWKNIGGLPGTSLTIQDVGVPNITLHGPKGLEELFHATKRFVILRDLKIKMAECDEKNYYVDNVMTVHYVPILKKTVISHVEDIKDGSKSIQVQSSAIDSGTSPGSKRNKKDCTQCSPSAAPMEDDIDYYAHERKGRGNRSRSTSPDGKRYKSPSKADTAVKLEALRANKELGTCMSYICKLQPRPGALSLEKCVRFGVPTGPLLGKLKMGEDVLLPSGVCIKSRDVCEPDDPGPVFLVVDCPSEDYLDSFVEHHSFKKHQVGINNQCEDIAYLVVHFTPQHILQLQRYREWVDKFPPSTHHLVLNEYNTCMGSISVHRVQHKLNMLHSGIFPLLGDKGTKTDTENEGSPVIKRLKLEGPTIVNTSSNICNVLEKAQNLLPKMYTYANTFCSFHLRPRIGLDRSSELKLKPNEYLEEPFTENGFKDTLEVLHRKLKDASRRLQYDNSYPRLLFLGTGSCIPNKTRNTSGILFEASENTNIIMDCGEGTYGQLVRFFGEDKVDSVLADIKAIFISHLHADHHIGLIGLLQGRRKALEKLNRVDTHPVILLAPKQILTWLNFYDVCFENILPEFELIPNSDLLFHEHTLYEGTQVRLYAILQMAEISTTYVRHCANAFGIAFRHKNGYKICYSGDTMPCEDLIQLGMNSDLLIHEATMEDELEHEALIKMHSTTSQAIEIGNNMSAKHILLTHFSQRYAKLPRFNDNFAPNVAIAFDNMRVHLDELPLLPLLYPALKIMFAEHYEELENKALKRQLKLDRREEALLNT